MFCAVAAEDRVQFISKLKHTKRHCSKPKMWNSSDICAGNCLILATMAGFRTALSKDEAPTHRIQAGEGTFLFLVLLRAPLYLFSVWMTLCHDHFRGKRPCPSPPALAPISLLRVTMDKMGFTFSAVSKNGVRCMVQRR